MKKSTKEINVFVWRLTSLHVITYFIIGLLSMNIFNYQDVFASGNLGLIMKPIDSPWVALGPGLQVLRGLIFALYFGHLQKSFS